MGFPFEMNKQLLGCGIWVTRPAGLAVGLCKAIEAHGGTPLLYPTLVIVPCFIEEQDWNVLSQVQQVIVTSQSALQYASKGMLQLLVDHQERLKILAIGSATAAFLNHLGLRVDYAPSVVGSDNLLLEAPLLQDIANQSIVLLTGKGGLSRLDDGLSARGAKVIRLETYERQGPPGFHEWERWQKNCQAITLGSVAALDNAYACLPGSEARDWLQSLIGFVGSQRILEELSHRYPNQSFQCAKSPLEADIVDALQFWWHSR